MAVDTYSVLQRLRRALQDLHHQHPSLKHFTPWPLDAQVGDARRTDHAARQAMQAETWGGGLDDAVLIEARDACLAAGPLAQWRVPYAGTKIDPDFTTRFGCYCIVGDGGFWSSATMAGYLVYMPAGLDYPMHHHPAEEMYVILAGCAAFRMQDQPPRQVAAGDAVFHPSNVPHATTTANAPLLAYVTWRNHLGTPPVWTDPALGR